MSTFIKKNQANSLPYSIRNAILKDKKKLENLLFDGEFIHQHMDWKSPIDWLGRQGFILAEKGEKVIGTLACPEHLSKVAWLRLFAALDGNTLSEIWEPLWREMERFLSTNGVTSVVCLVTNYWFLQLLESSGFREFNRVTSLILRNKEIMPPKMIDNYSLHLMKTEDLDQVFEVDQLAFEPIWQNLLEDFQTAYQLASSSTVIKNQGSIVGYQISTSTKLGTHLARLAVHPIHQRKGLGNWLLNDLIFSESKKNYLMITVNTQKDNFQSIKLYQQAGFVFSGEVYPVYMVDLQK